MLDSGVLPRAAEQAIERAKMLPARRKRQEWVDLDRMNQKERLRVLCRCAMKMGVLK